MARKRSTARWNAPPGATRTPTIRGPNASPNALKAPRPSADELAAFYADMVNSDRYLPANTISNTLRDAMLARGLVTPERLRARGVR